MRWMFDKTEEVEIKQKKWKKGEGDWERQDANREVVRGTDLVKPSLL